MKYKTAKCKCCNLNYTIVNFITVREFGFCSKQHAIEYIIKGFNKP